MSNYQHLCIFKFNSAVQVVLWNSIVLWIKMYTHFNFLFVPHCSTVYGLAWSVTVVNPAQTAEPINMSFGLWTRVVPRKRIRWGSRSPMCNGIFEGERGGPLWSIGTFCHELCKNSWNDWDAVSGMDSGWPKEACVSWGAHWHILANTIEWSMCGGDAAFLTNYFDHLFIFVNVLSDVHDVFMPATYNTTPGMCMCLHVCRKTFKSLVVVCHFDQSASVCWSYVAGRLWRQNQQIQYLCKASFGR